VTCTILPSNVAFTSLVSAAGVPSAAAYGLICLGRLFCTPNRFPKPQWSLGRWSKPFQFIGVFWNGWVVAILISPYEWPVTGQTLNCKLTRFSLPVVVERKCSHSFLLDAPIIMGGVTILALVSYFVMPESAWLPRNRITHFIDSKGAGTVTETVEEVSPSAQNDMAQRS
jgi:amino acid transporter